MIFNGDQKTYYGNSGEVKPTYANETNTFYEVDTGNVFLFFNGKWNPML